MFNIKLNKGDTIGVVCPSGPLSLFLKKSILDGLESFGYEVKLPSNYSFNELYLAGHDNDRLEAFLDVWMDPKVKIVWAARGGYGACRLLEHLPYEMLRNNCKPFIGMSDITALHLAFIKNGLTCSYLGPTLSYLFPENESGLHKEMRDDLFALFLNQDSYLSYLDNLFATATVLNEGVGQGELVGGNLTVLSSLIGTPWELCSEGKILVLEDVNEPLYKIDRMLFQCEKSGTFRHLNGLILASFENKDPLINADLISLFNHYFKEKKYPVIFGAQIGHLSYQKIIPLKALVRLSSFHKKKPELNFL